MLLVGAAALLLAVRLADRDRVSDVLLRRMGFSARDLALSRTWEVAGVVGSAVRRRRGRRHRADAGADDGRAGRVVAAA